MSTRVYVGVQLVPPIVATVCCVVLLGCQGGPGSQQAADEAEGSLTADTNILGGSSGSNSFTQQQSRPGSSPSSNSRHMPAERSAEQLELPGSSTLNQQQQQQVVPVLSHQQQQLLQSRASLASAYPTVTADSLPAAAVVAGCSVCSPPGGPAPGSGSGGSSGSGTSAPAAGSLVVSCSGSSTCRSSVTSAAREVVRLTAAPTLEVGLVCDRTAAQS